MHVEKHSLFTVPYWRSRFDDISAYFDEMYFEVDKLITQELEANSDNPFLAHQSFSDPFNLPSKGWEILDRSIRACFSDVILSNFSRQRAGEMHLRRWAVRYGNLSTEERAVLSEQSVHNHMPALLSSIFYLSVPASTQEAGVSGTKYFNPTGGHLRLLTDNEVIIEACEGDLVIFPAQVDHTTLTQGWAPSKEERSRIVIVCDVYYVGGFQDREKDDRVQSVSIT